jgi:hypothetical protein
LFNYLNPKVPTPTSGLGRPSSSIPPPEVSLEGSGGVVGGATIVVSPGMFGTVGMVVPIESGTCNDVLSFGAIINSFLW